MHVGGFIFSKLVFAELFMIAGRNKSRLLPDKKEFESNSEHEAAKWLTKAELDNVDWLPADMELIPILKNML